MKSRGDRLEHRAVVDERGHQGALLHPPKCAASGRVIQAGCQLWMIKTIGSPTRPCSGWPLPFTAHSPRGSAWCSTSRKAETMLGRSFSGKTARGPRRRGACGKGRRSTCPRFLACYSNTNKDCIERYERGEVKRRFSTQPRRVGTLRGDPRPAARCGERDVFRSNDDECKQARLLMARQMEKQETRRMERNFPVN